MFGMLAIAGAPPFGLFISEFLVLYAIVNHGASWLAVLLVICLVILFGNFLRYAIQIGYGEPSRELRLQHGHKEGFGILMPTTVHLALTLVLGTVIPFVANGILHSTLFS